MFCANCWVILDLLMVSTRRKKGNTTMPLSPFTMRFRRRGLAVFVGLAMAGNVQAADLWTITQDALANDAELASVQVSFQATEAARDVQRGTLLPQISLSAEAAHSRNYNGGQALPGGGASGGSPAAEDDENRVGLTAGLEQVIYNPTLNAQLERAVRE